MKKILIAIFVFASMHVHSQNGNCSDKTFGYSDVANNFSICISKNYTVKHIDAGVSIVDTSNEDNGIIIQSITNAKNTSVADWSSSIQKNLSKNSSISFTSEGFSLETNAGTYIKGNHLIKKVSGEASETHISFVPLTKDCSKILLILYIVKPNSESIRDVVFNARVLLMMLTLKLLS